MAIKLVNGGHTLNVISVYTPQVGLDEEVKRHFLKDLDEVVHGTPHTEKQFIGGDFNSHIGETARSYDEVHGGFSFGDRNEGGTSLLDFTKAFDLVITSTCFQKREEHLITLGSKVAKAQTDYLLFRRCEAFALIASLSRVSVYRLNICSCQWTWRSREQRRREQCTINRRSSGEP
ncbi:uncharacterized protein [Nicotiana tomentosiformis]|uniref:uncharacterized protein n=1 Tax=Nicotiana tomentosiformis TaxID=4098 RepID=UPI00388C6EFD